MRPLAGERPRAAGKGRKRGRKEGREGGRKESCLRDRRRQSNRPETQEPARAGTTTPHRPFPWFTPRAPCPAHTLCLPPLRVAPKGKSGAAGSCTAGPQPCPLTKTPDTASESEGQAGGGHATQLTGEPAAQPLGWPWDPHSSNLSTNSSVDPSLQTTVSPLPVLPVGAAGVSEPTGVERPLQGQPGTPAQVLLQLTATDQSTHGRHESSPPTAQPPAGPPVCRSGT